MDVVIKAARALSAKVTAGWVQQHKVSGTQGVFHLLLCQVHDAIQDDIENVFRGGAVEMHVRKVDGDAVGKRDGGKLIWWKGKK